LYRNILRELKGMHQNAELRESIGSRHKEGTSWNCSGTIREAQKREKLGKNSILFGTREKGVS
jgi:hypothetical protein